MVSETGTSIGSLDPDIACGSFPHKVVWVIASRCHFLSFLRNTIVGAMPLKMQDYRDKYDLLFLSTI